MEIASRVYSGAKSLPEKRKERIYPLLSRTVKYNFLFNFRITRQSKEAIIQGGIIPTQLYDQV